VSLISWLPPQVSAKLNISQPVYAGSHLHEGQYHQMTTKLKFELVLLSISTHFCACSIHLILQHPLGWGWWAHKVYFFIWALHPSLQEVHFRLSDGQTWFFFILRLANETLTDHESATCYLSRDVVESSDLPLHEIVQLICEWVSFLSVPISPSHGQFFSWGPSHLICLC